MADIDREKYPALHWILGHGTGNLWVDTEPAIASKYGERWTECNGDLAPFARSELSQLIADVEREAKAEAYREAAIMASRELRFFNVAFDIDSGQTRLVRTLHEKARRFREGEE